ncbi:nucleolin-like isoform X2 [Liolophura sinensis]|uniref:nucleolin-like isoform X2 n=1 Tax=Liolophura sinensis TaxID=3198878 RepID=UPI003158710F
MVSRFHDLILEVAASREKYCSQTQVYTTQMAPKQVKAAKAGKKQKVKKAPPKKVVQEASEESSDEDSEEEEIETPVVKKKAKPVVRAKEEDSDDSSEEDSDEEEETPPINGAKAKLSEKQNGKTEENDDEDDEDDDDDDEDDDDEEEEEEEAPPPKAKPQKRKDKPAAKPKQQAMEVEEDEDDDEEDSEEEEDDSDSEEEAVSNNQGKRKKGQADKPSKKAKTDTVTLFVNRLSTKTTEETLKSFLEENGVGVKSIQRLPKKKFAFVVLEDPADLDKAVALSGQTLEDKEIMIEKAKAEPRSPPPAATPDKPKASPVKKGNTEDEEEGSKLVVKNLSKTVTEDMLKEAFPTAVSMRMPLFPRWQQQRVCLLDI